MTISQVSTGTRYNNSGSTWATYGFTKHTGSAAGDLAIVAFSFYENGQTAGPSLTGTNWTTNKLGEWILGGSGTTESRLIIWYAELGGSENTTLTLNVNAGGGSVYATAVYATIRGTGALTFASKTDGTKVSSTTVTAPSVSTTSGQGIVVVVGNANDYAITPPVGVFTTAIEGAETNTANAAGIYFKTAGGGTEGTWDFTSGTSDDLQAFTLLINDAGETGGGGGNPWYFYANQ